MKKFNYLDSVSKTLALIDIGDLTILVLFFAELL